MWMHLVTSVLELVLIVGSIRFEVVPPLDLFHACNH